MMGKIHTLFLVKSYQNGVNHNTGVFRLRHPPVSRLCPVISFPECSTTCVGGNFAETRIALNE